MPDKENNKTAIYQVELDYKVTVNGIVYRGVQTGTKEHCELLLAEQEKIKKELGVK